MAPRPIDTPLTATPTLERLLMQLRGRLQRLVIVRALGLATAAAIGWLAWAYFADYVLEVPRAVRTFHGIGLIALPAYLLWRTGWRHLRRLPDRRDLAVLLEAREPSQDLLTTATCFQLDPSQSQLAPPAMVARVLAAAEERAKAIAQARSERKVLDNRETKQAGLVSGALLLVFALATWVWPHHQQVFASRLFGQGLPWPQLTFLAFEIPLDSGVTQDGQTTRVRIARGEDLPITVIATGRAPENVELIFDDGSRRALAQAGEREGNALYTTSLRSIAKDLSFTVEGGDDKRREDRVEVLALIPPDLVALVARVEPPSYSGLSPETFKNSDLTVLEGSRITLVAQVEPPSATGIVRLLPEDRTLELERTTEGLAFEFVAERSLRLRYELIDSEGLANPDPGLWSITVNEDHAPRLAVRSPESLNLETTASGIVPLWVTIQDDFAIRGADLLVTPRDGGEVVRQSLELRGVDPKPYVFAPLALSSITATPEAGQTHWLEVEARDNREPSPNLGRSPKVAVRVLSNEDYMRRVQDRLAGTRRRVSELYDLQRDKLERTEELLDALIVDGLGSAPLDSSTRADLDGLQSGARRIEADALSIAREVTAMTGDALHARIDPEATGQVNHLDRLLERRATPDFDAAMWRDLIAEHNAGRLGKAGFAANLLDLSQASLDVALESARKAREALEAVPRADKPLVALEAAIVREREALAAIEALLGRLAEWDNFQSVLSLTREVLERQRALKERTMELATQ